jgi:hypothetical protein
MATSKQHYHFIIWAAEGKTDAAYSGVTYIELIAKSVDEALKRAKDMVPNKAFYHINNIIEHHGHEEKNA